MGSWGGERGRGHRRGRPGHWPPAGPPTRETGKAGWLRAGKQDLRLCGLQSGLAWRQKPPCRAGGLTMRGSSQPWHMRGASWSRGSAALLAQEGEAALSCPLPLEGGPWTGSWFSCLAEPCGRAGPLFPGREVPGHLRGLQEWTGAGHARSSGSLCPQSSSKQMLAGHLLIVPRQPCRAQVLSQDRGGLRGRKEEQTGASVRMLGAQPPCTLTAGSLLLGAPCSPLVNLLDRRCQLWNQSGHKSDLVSPCSHGPHGLVGKAGNNACLAQNV